MSKRNSPLRQTLTAPADYALLQRATARGPLAVALTLPVDLASYAALAAMRDEVIGDLYNELLEPA